MSPNPSDNPSKAFDAAKLWRNFDDDRDFLAEQVERFGERYPPQLDALRAAVAAGDGAATKELAHKLAGSFTNFAARPAWSAAVRIEESGAAGDAAGARAGLAELEREVVRLVAALRVLASGS